MTTQTPAVKKREIFGWAMYDFANSSYTTVVVTFIYSTFFVAYIVPPEMAHLKNSFWSLAVALSTGIALFLAPFVGVLCDCSGNKKKYLAYCTAASVLGTLGLFFVEPGQIWLGLALVVVSNTAWMVSESFIASFLPELSTPKNMGKVSGIGWGIGYLGGLFSMLLILLLFPSDLMKGSEAYIDRNQLAMALIALFYFVCALPTFLLVKERAKPQAGFEHANFKMLCSAALSRLLRMRELIKEYPILFRFFLAFMVYSAGVAVLVKFFGIYTQEEIGITGGEFALVGMILQVSAALGAIGFGFIETRIGSKNTVLISITWWILGILGIYFIKEILALTGFKLVPTYVAIAFIAGAALGAIQSSSRAIVGKLSKPKDAALLFGLWGTFARFAIIIGMTFGPISDMLGRHSALLFILVYFIVGGFMLARTPLKD